MVRTTFFRLTSESKPTKEEAAVGDSLVVLAAATGQVESLWVMTDRLNPVDNSYWWEA